MTANEIISKAVVQLTTHYIIEQIPFNIMLINNDVDWEPALPEELQNIVVPFSMLNTDLEDSYASEKGIVLTVGIDDIVYTKVIRSYDIQAVGEHGKPYALIKQFTETPKDYVPIEGSVKWSDEVLAKYNPHLFNPLGAV